MPNSRPYNVQAPPCCRHLKCLNRRPVTWDQITLLGAGGTVSPTNPGLDVVSANNGAVEVQDASTLINPSSDFEIVVSAQNKSGPGFMGVGLSDNDTVNTAFLLIQISGSNVQLYWGQDAQTTFTNLNVSNNREMRTYRLRKKGSKIRFSIEGVTAQEITIDSKFPTRRINPAFFVGDIANNATDGLLAAFCVGKI